MRVGRSSQHIAATLGFALSAPPPSQTERSMLCAEHLDPRNEGRTSAHCGVLITIGPISELAKVQRTIRTK